MVAQDTREKILDAAEQLFADRGFVATSIRDVTTEAQVNLAAVHYHFGSKEDLFRAVLERVMRPANERRLAMMDAAEQKRGGPTVDDLLRAFILPELQLVHELGPRGSAIARLLGRMFSEPNESMHDIAMELFSEVGGQFISGLQRALPHLPPEEVVFRMQCTVAVLSFFMADTVPAPWKVLDLADPEGTAERIVAFLLPAMSAPVRNPATM
jgi:AcrR family transcriptional regulator